MATEDQPGPTHNSGDRKTLIQEACRELERMDAEIRELQEARTNYRAEVIKGRLGMKLADFAAARRLYSLEAEARDTMMDTIRETFDALGAGEQLDWVAAAERKTAARRAEDAEAAAA